MTESPNGTHIHVLTNMRSWGSYLFHVGLFISQMNRCHPLPLILPQMLLKTRKEKKERCLVWMSTWCMQSSREYKHLRPLVLSFDYTALYHNGRKVIKCKETIIVKGSCNDDHQDLKVITWFIMILCNQTHGYFFVSKKKKGEYVSSIQHPHICTYMYFSHIPKYFQYISQKSSYPTTVLVESVKVLTTEASERVYST